MLLFLSGVVVGVVVTAVACAIWAFADPPREPIVMGSTAPR